MSSIHDTPTTTPHPCERPVDLPDRDDWGLDEEVEIVPLPTEKSLRSQLATTVAQWRKLANMSEELSLHSYTYQHRCWHGGRAEIATELADMLERILTDTEVSPCPRTDADA